MRASVNYVGNTSMIIGIRVDAENIQTGKIKHCNSSYFTMVAKDESGNPNTVPGLILSDFEDVRRFYNCIKMISNRKEKQKHEDHFDYKNEEALANLANFNVQLTLI
jgi:acyl-CoA hydrolase